MRGMHSGVMTIEGTFRGMLNGTGVVPAGADATIEGMVNGTLIVGRDAHVRITGMVNGAVIDRGATIEVTGMVSR